MSQFAEPLSEAAQLLEAAGRKKVVFLEGEENRRASHGSVAERNRRGVVLVNRGVCCQVGRPVDPVSIDCLFRTAVCIFFQQPCASPQPVCVPPVRSGLPLFPPRECMSDASGERVMLDTSPLETDIQQEPDQRGRSLSVRFKRCATARNNLMVRGVNTDMRLLQRPVMLLVTGLLLVPSDSQPQHSGPFHPPSGALVAGLRETATHRDPLPALRITSGREAPATASFWLHLDQTGHVLEVEDIRTEDYQQPHFDPSELIEAIRKVTYAPFMVKGSPQEVWAQEQIGLLPREEVISTPSQKSISAFQVPSPSTNFSIRLFRSGCYGSCPAYEVTIHGDGKVSYKGHAYVSIEGDHSTEISREDASQLLDSFRKANFFSLRNEYHAGVTDCPTYTLELTVGTRKKIVTDYMGDWVGMPAEITELEEAIDQTAGTSRWVTASDQTLEAMQEAGIDLSSNQANKILHRAVMYGKADAVRDLLRAGIRTTEEDSPKGVVERGPRSGSLLEGVESYRAASPSRKEVMAALLESPAVREDKAGLQKALGRAVAEGQAEIARMLIAAGADPQSSFQDTGNADEKPNDQTFLMRAVESGVWAMIEDALSRPHDIHAVDQDGRSALAMVIWTSPQGEDIFPIADKLIADGAEKKELDRALADACDHPEWHDGLVARGANPQVCKEVKK